MTDNTDDVAAGLAVAFESEAPDALASRLSLIGSPSEIGERLHERRERYGYSYTVIPAGKAHDSAPIVAELTRT